MDHSVIVNNTISHVKDALREAEGGHDWHHIERVWNTAKAIGVEEGGDMLIIELGALLHDIADSKFHNGDEELGPQRALEYMNSIRLSDHVKSEVVSIIKHISFKGGHSSGLYKSKELDVVQDADRLDAIGAVGIARAFNYGGFKNRAIYDPSIAPNLNMSKEEYKNSTAPTINHFYEKLLLLKDKMNTPTGKALAEQRHAFMEAYLTQFYLEVKTQK